MYYYTYKVTSKSGKYYVGRHSSEHPNDSYKGSGLWVRGMSPELREELQKNVICYYDNEEQLKEAEKKLISECIDDPLNMNFNDNPIGFSSGKLNPQYGRKTGLAGPENGMYGKKHPNHVTLKGEAHHLYGKSLPKETREKISKAKQGIPASEETKKKLREMRAGKQPPAGCSFAGRTHNEETIAKISEAAKKRPKKVCPHCGKIAAVNVYSRWHGERCKHNAVHT